MLMEFFRQLFTPCSWAAKRLGYVTSGARVRGRYLRCELAWAPHLIRTREVIEEAVRRCSMKRKVALFGAGLLHDIPLKELSRQFEEVLLVDIVHPWHCRLAVRKFPNVKLITHDVTEVINDVHRCVHEPLAELPASRPMRFVDDSRLDLTISVNLLSQLPVIPDRLLTKARSADVARAFGKHLVAAHLDYLKRLPGLVTLVTDVAAKKVSLGGDVVDRWSILYGTQLLEPDQQWDWCLAPSPEQEKGFHFIREVVAFVDWKQSSQPRAIDAGA